MKFTWFNLMPWPHLPVDFREQHRSVCVDIPSSLYDPVKGHEVYNSYLDQLEYAESVGFDGIGVNEHHANAYGLMPSPKAGTVTTEVAATVKEYKAGKIEFRVDKFGNVHAVVGKLSFDETQLVENAGALVRMIEGLRPSSAKGTYVRSLTISATMTPGIAVAA